MSRRRGGGAIRMDKKAKLALREEEEIEKDVEVSKKFKEPVKTKPIAKLLRGQVQIIKEESKNLTRTKNFSFFGDKEIDLSKIELKVGISQIYNPEIVPKISLSKQNSITIQTEDGPYQGQYYLDYEINPYKKYTLKFTIQSFSNFYFFVGLMRKDQISYKHMYSGTSGLFFKRFLNSRPKEDCSKVLQGKLFGKALKPGSSFEMRFCIKHQILEFSTLPKHNNIVSKLDHAMFDTSPSVHYVITLNTYNKLGFSFDSLKEGFYLSQNC